MAKPRGLKEDIFKLRKEGKTYNQIAEELKCSKSNVSYHLEETYRKKRRILRQKQHPLIRRVEYFLAEKIYSSRIIKKNRDALNKILYHRVKTFSDSVRTMSFTVKELLEKIGETPVCYLTGIPIDLNKPRTYQLDHIIPVSRGGPNTLENCGLTSRNANQAKSDMSIDEFINLCKQILTHNGYTVKKEPA